MERGPSVGRRAFAFGELKADPEPVAASTHIVVVNCQSFNNLNEAWANFGVQLSDPLQKAFEDIAKSFNRSRFE